MRITKISEQFAVSPQISVEDVATAAAQGYKTIMCNRPDNEEFGQPSAQTIEAAAKAHGLDFHWVPVSHQGMAPDTLDR
ncbi:MAG TPA: sulfur transferase domain-containing protein, partial [Paracoccaceae bacterium]|nr:sulfur transferase domain-containing protein [Paracoccaceae bacterium]